MNGITIEITRCGLSIPTNVQEHMGDDCRWVGSGSANEDAHRVFTLVLYADLESGCFCRVVQSSSFMFKPDEINSTLPLIKSLGRMNDPIYGWLVYIHQRVGQRRRDPVASGSVSTQSIPVSIVRGACVMFGRRRVAPLQVATHFRRDWSSPICHLAPVKGRRVVPNSVHCASWPVPIDRSRGRMDQAVDLERVKPSLTR